MTKMAHICKCFFPNCKDDIFIYRKNRFDTWLSFCSKHWSMIECVIIDDE